MNFLFLCWFWRINHLSFLMLCRHLGYFHFESFMNSTAVNITVHIFLDLCWGYIPISWKYKSRFIQYMYPNRHHSLACVYICVCVCARNMCILSFLRSQLFSSGGQSIGASVSVLPMNIQDWFSLGLTAVDLGVQGTLKSLLQHHSSKTSVLWPSAFFVVQLSHSYTTTGKTIALTRQVFVGSDVSTF